MNRRLLAIALLTVGCGGEDDRGFRNPRWWELSALQVDRRLAVQQLRLHQVLDSLPALVGRFPAGAATFVAGADSAPPLEHQKITTTLGRLWPPGGANDVRLAVAFYRPSVLDSARRHGVFEGTILPERTDGKTCVIAIAEQRNWQRDWVSPNERRLRSLVAPCLYLARFGHPGHAVARWLSETGYQGVQSAEWLFRPGVPTLSFDYWGQSDRGEWISPLLVAFGRDQLPPYWSGAPAVGCLAGRAGSCDEFVRGPRRSYRRAALPVSESPLTQRVWAKWTQARRRVQPRPPARGGLRSVLSHHPAAGCGIAPARSGRSTKRGLFPAHQLAPSGRQSVRSRGFRHSFR